MKPIYSLTVSLILLTLIFISNLMQPGYLKFWIPSFKVATAQAKADRGSQEPNNQKKNKKINLGDFIK